MNIIHSRTAWGIGLVLVATVGMFSWVGYHHGSQLSQIERSGAEIEVGWPNFAADEAATQSSPLAQITVANVSKLKVAWIYRTGDPLENSAFEDTPTTAGGSLIVCTPHQNLIALNPETGAERWRFDPHVRQQMTRIPNISTSKWVCRGVASWFDASAAPGSSCAERLFLATLDRRVIAVDAKSGRKCPGFGDGGEIRVQPERPLIADSELQFNSPPVVVNGVVVIGSRVMDGSRIDGVHGTIRAYDARTGAVKWQFDPIPKDPSDPAWPSWHVGISPAGPIQVGAANVWADMSVDSSLNLVFLPTTSPSTDFWGGGRPGDDRHSDSVLAVDATTGRLIWSYQTIHHDLFDRDLPSAPLLADLSIGGKVVPAAIQLAKTGFIFVFDRRSGLPLFPIAERHVPQSTLPGEHSSLTQPFPEVMPSLMPTNGLQPGEAWGFTPFDRAACRRKIASYKNRDMFSPPSVEGAIVYPGYMGGPSLGHRAYDRERHLLIANTTRVAMIMRMKARTQEKPTPGDTGPTEPFVISETDYLLSPLGAPCNPPPWGMLTGIDVEHHRIVWQKSLGTIEKLAPIPLPLALGTPSRGGPIVTGSGLTFIAATMDDRFRAFETSSGKELWNVHLPAGGQATPMTYQVRGRQYVVIAAGGHSMMHTTPGDFVIAFALPDH
jgi:quinoprotein glucose dehydrogenase